MKTLLLLRHAKSSWDQPLDDHDRPLASRGERDAPRLGRFIASTGLELDYVVASTAVRARRTAELAAKAAGFGGKLKTTERIYEAPTANLIEVLQGIPDSAETAMMVGHNPGFEGLLGLLCGSEHAEARIRVPTAALACVELSVARWAEAGAGCGVLLWHVVPKILKALRD
jgi:phosphohistidine phosphatase